MFSKQLTPMFSKVSQGLHLQNSSRVSEMVKAMSTSSSYKTLNVTVPKPFIYHVELNRPEKLNAFNETMWKMLGEKCENATSIIFTFVVNNSKSFCDMFSICSLIQREIGECFTSLGDQDDCRVVLLSGNGRLFTAGIDFNSMISLGQTLSEHEDVARRCKILKNLIHKYQDSITSLEKCVKPVISLVHNACIGAGVDLITAADIRYCTEDAVFQVKEVGIGMAADVGTLQRLPRVVGSSSLVNELAFTARKLLASEAKECGLVNRIYKDKESMISEALQIAEDISKKSPVAVQVTKRSLIFSRDHPVQESLNHIADWNQTMLQSEDFMNASVSEATKSTAPVFAKL